MGEGSRDMRIKMVINSVMTSVSQEVQDDF